MIYSGEVPKLLKMCRSIMALHLICYLNYAMYATQDRSLQIKKRFFNVLKTLIFGYEKRFKKTVFQTFFRACLILSEKTFFKNVFIWFLKRF